MPRSPLSHELVITQDFWASPGEYPKDVFNPQGRHTGLDLSSHYDDPWFACVPGFVHLGGVWPYLVGYGAYLDIDWGKPGGGHIAVRYAHSHNRRKEYDNHHVGEGTLLAYSGATGNVKPRGKNGAHLHLECRNFDERGRFLGYLDPKKVLLDPFKIPYRFR